MSRAETVYIGRANVIRRELQVDGVSLTVQQKAAITKVQFRMGDICLDTAVGGDPITYDDGIVEIQAGLIPSIAEGEEIGKLIVYDADNLEGKAWGSFEVVIVPWEACEE